MSRQEDERMLDILINKSILGENFTYEEINTLLKLQITRDMDEDCGHECAIYVHGFC